MSKKEELLIKSNGQWSLEKRCWDGYEPTPGKKPYEEGSCKPETKKGEMDGVEVGGSKDSKNTKTYEKEFEKDDKPHAPGSAKDSAHDVVEEGRSLEEELKDLSPEERDDMLAHLRTLKSKREHRSKENRKAGSMNKEDYNGNLAGGNQNDKNTRL